MFSEKFPKESRAGYRAERDGLVEQLQRVLAEDERVVAAWLWGSLGKGTSDDFSDLDIWIVVRDDALAAIRAERQNFAAQIGALRLFAEAPQNAPRGGTYLMAAYEGMHGPHLADWYWQPQNQMTGIPTDALVLVNRASLPATGQPTQLFPADPEDIAAAHPTGTPQQELIDVQCNNIRVFWAMLLISAKYILRQRNDEPLFLYDMLQNLQRDAHQFAGISVSETKTAAPTAALAKIALLRQFTETMETVTSHLEIRGITSLPVTMPESVRRYLTMVEANSEP